MLFKKKILYFVSFLVFYLLSVSSPGLAQADTWKTKADMPTARMGLSICVVDGKIYALGGYQKANAPGLTTVEVYDPSTDTWTTKAPMPTGRRQLAVSVVNGRIYAIGGYTNFRQPGLSIVEEYDPATDSWTRKADMPTARLGLATSVVNGIIYAIGGSSKVPQPLRTVEAYDPVTNTWTKKADMPTARFFLSTSVVDGKIYAIGGSYGSPNQTHSIVEEYDPATDTWTEKADIPTPRFGLATSVVNGKIYAIGGAIGYDVLSTVEEYDPTTDTWTSKTSMPDQRAAFSAITVNGKIYAIGGALTIKPPHPAVSTVEEYDTGWTSGSAAELIPITFNSHGSKLSGYFSRAKGEGSHPTIIFLHGSPGGPKDVLGLAEAAPSAGWNALVFNYRGFWNSEGVFSLKNSLEDVFSALTFLKSDKTIKKYGVDVNHLALAGYSFGGNMALIAAANDSSIKHVIAIAAADMSEIARQIEKSDEVRAMMTAILNEQFKGPVKGAGSEAAISELLANSDKYDLVKHAQNLSLKSLLIIGGWQDQQSTLEAHVLPLIRALQGHEAENVEKVILDTDHSFKGKRTELVNIVIDWLKEHHPQKNRDVFILTDNSDIRVIKQIHKKAADAIKNGDVAAYVDLFTEDGIYLWPGEPAIVGREALLDWFEKRFNTYSAELEKTIEEIVILGDWAFERGKEVSKITNRSTGEVTVVKGKFINIFKRQGDGFWKVARRIRNLDHSPCLE